jgi:hypothetical protein
MGVTTQELQTLLDQMNKLKEEMLQDVKEKCAILGLRIIEDAAPTAPKQKRKRRTKAEIRQIMRSRRKSQRIRFNVWRYLMTPRTLFLTALLFVSPTTHAEEWKLQSLICCTRHGCSKLSDYPYRLTQTGLELRLQTGRWCHARISSAEVINVLDRPPPYDECERVRCIGP